MKPIDVIPLAGRACFGDPGLRLLEDLTAALARAFRVTCRIQPEVFDISATWDAGRGQYYSTAILQRLARANSLDVRVLGVTVCDLYVPVLTFVFGEAQLEGNCAVASAARLKEEFYGLPRRDELLRERLLKEAAHELTAAEIKRKELIEQIDLRLVPDREGLR